MLKAYDVATGKEVKSGDVVTDFRGDKSTFVSPTRARTYKSGKVAVKDDNGKEREYYDKVFNLIVKDEPEQ